MSLFIPVENNKIVSCQLCCEKITFVERRGTGFWIPSDVIQDPDTLAWGYRTKILSGTGESSAILHRCWGDPNDPTTKNGRKKEYLEKLGSLQERTRSVILRVKITQPDLDEMQAVCTSPEYLDLQREHNDIIREYADLFQRQ
jgi:hypothetical protein